MLKLAKEQYNKLINLWQSKKVKVTNIRLSIVLFMLFSVICFLFARFVESDKGWLYCVAYIAYFYLGIVFAIIAALFAVWGFYFNNSCRRLKNAAKIFLNGSIFITLCAIVAGSLFLLVLILITKLIDLRAKKIDNINIFLIIFAIHLLVITFMINPNLTMTRCVVNKIGLWIYKSYRIRLNEFSAELFIMISLSIGESFLLLQIFDFFRKHVNNKSQVKYLNNVETNFIQNSGERIDDLPEYIIAKNKKLDNEKKKLVENSKEERIYVWNSIKRVWLLILIIFFIAAVFNILPVEGNECANSDIINVLTIYTLILLYLDKRKEWK